MGLQPGAPTASPVYQLPEGVTGLGLNALVRNALVNLPRLRLHFEFPPLSSPSMRRFQLALQLERLLKAVVTVCLREQDVGGHTADLGSRRRAGARNRTVGRAAPEFLKRSAKDNKCRRLLCQTYNGGVSEK